MWAMSRPLLQNAYCHLYAVTSLDLCNTVCVLGDMLYHIYKDNLCLVLKTRSEIESALRECHDDRSGGHRGVLITRKKLMMSYYWKTMTDDVKSWVSLC